MKHQILVGRKALGSDYELIEGSFDRDQLRSLKATLRAEGRWVGMIVIRHTPAVGAITHILHKLNNCNIVGK